MATINKVMNSKDLKVFFNKINQNFGISIDVLKDIFKDYVLIRKKDDVWIINRGVDINTIKDHFLISQIGIYLCEFHDNILRFSIEGTIFLGEYVNKNIIEIDDDLTKEWLQKKDLDISSNFLLREQVDKIVFNNFVILKNKEFFLGCGFIKDNKILNFIPKSRCIVNEIW